MQTVNLSLALWLGCVFATACSASRHIDLGKPVEDRQVQPAAVSGSAGAAPVDMPAPAGPSTLPRAMPRPPSAAPASALAPVSIDQTGPDNPAGLSQKEVDALIAGGPTGDRRFLYPYEGTVFPRGTLPPVLMWDSDPATDALYLRIKARAFEYRSVLKPTPNAVPPGSPFVGFMEFARTTQATSAGLPAGQPVLEIPRDIWVKACQQALGKSDEFTVEVTERANGKVSGPFVTRLIIAPGSVLGSVYYQNVSDPSTNLPVLLSGRVMRVPAGGVAHVVAEGQSYDANLTPQQCPGCHTVSSNGSRMLVQWSDRSTLTGSAYGIDASGAAAKTSSRSGENVMFAALYPDGSKYLSSTLGAFGELNAMSITSAFTNLDFLNPEYTARLHDTATGEVIPDTGIPSTAAMPMFSPDGRYLAFNEGATFRELAVMDYDLQQHKAGNYRVVYREDAASATRPGWPFFTPDNRALIYARTDSSSFTAGVQAGVGVTGAASGGLDLSALAPRSDLYVLDLRTGKSTILARAMGYATPADAATDETYLPFGAEELHRNYLPSVSPVAQGGYFWLFFDSLRRFGHLGYKRQLWVAAIDIQPDSGDYSIDPSHPPFYLPGQSFGIANHRAFAALDACKPTDGTCTTGIECCPGTTCYFPKDAGVDEFGATVGSCTPLPPQPTCSVLDERCGTSADCCDSSHYCINAFCAYVELL